MSTLSEYAQIRKLKGFITRLIKNYNKKFVILMFCTYFCLKGFIASCIDLNTLPFIKNHLKVNETTYQIYILVAWIPWSTKAFMGSLSDLYPLFGYHKKWYIIISSFFGSLALLLLATIKFSKSTQILAPILMFLVMLQISIVDLLCEAKYAKQMRAIKNSGSEAVSFVWICVTIGSLVASSFVGVFTDYFNPKWIFLICVPFSVQIFYPVIKNYMGEIKIPLNEVKLNREKLYENFNMFGLAFAMAILAIGMGIVNLFANRFVVLLYSIFSSLFLCGCSLLFLDPIKAKCYLFLFVVECSYVQIPGALDYFYTADSTCVSKGPSFDMTYYLTYTNILAAVASVFGITFFQMIMSNWSFRKAFAVSSVIRISSSFFDILIIYRINIRLGIPDKMAYLLGDALIFNTAAMMASMPAILLTATIVTDGLESTTYALLAGFQNFGSNVSKSIGVFMMGAFGIDADSRPCDFRHLGSLVFVCHSVLPLIPLALIRLLIPDERPGKKEGGECLEGYELGNDVSVDSDSSIALDGLDGEGVSLASQSEE